MKFKVEFFELQNIFKGSLGYKWIAELCEVSRALLPADDLGW